MSLSFCLPLMRKVAKPQVLTEGEITHLANFAGSAIEFLSFSRQFLNKGIRMFYRLPEYQP